MKIMNQFRKYGRTCSYYDSEGVKINEASAFISPLRYKNKMYLYGVNTEIGYNSEGYYLYIGPGEVDITGDNQSLLITSDESTYKIDRAEKVYAGENLFYIWAVIRKTVEIEDEDDD